MGSQTATRAARLESEVAYSLGTHPDCYVAPSVSPQLTLFAEAFPANRIPWLADVPVPTTSVTSGPSSSDSFASLNPDGSWRKTCQGYSQATLDGSLETFSETWPRAGMTRSGTAYQRQPLAPLTDETESGSWPTPDASAANIGEPVESWVARRRDLKAKGINGNGCGMPLGIAAKMWPTPQAHDTAKGNPDRVGRFGTKHGGRNLNDEIALWATPTA